MRVVVLGAGAVGGAIGGSLFENGHDVLLVARGAHLDALASTGLLLETPDGARTLPVPVVPDVRAVDWRKGDVALLAVKSQDTLTLVRELAAAAPASLPVVCAQNGVENERVTLRHFPRVYGMCVICPATHLEPGTVLVHASPVRGLLDVGPWPSGMVDRIAGELVASLDQSGFDTVARSDIARWKWAKLLVNLGNAADALCGPGMAAGTLARAARREALRCIEAAGIDCAGRDEVAERRARLALAPAGGVSRAGSSTWQSLRRGSGVEVDYLNGEVVVLGRLHGVPTPVNELLQRLVHELAVSGGPPGSLSEAEVLAVLGDDTGHG